MSKILLPSMHLKLGLMKNFVKAMNQEGSCLYLLTRKVPQTEWGKIERRYFHWSTNMRPYQGRILRQAPSRRWKGSLGQFYICSKRIFGKQEGSKQWGACKQPFAELPEIRLQHVTKNTLPSLVFGFFPRELWCSEWWTPRTFPSRHFFNGEEISREMELCYAHRLLLDFGKGCNTSDRQNEKKLHDFICVK